MGRVDDVDLNCYFLCRCEDNRAYRRNVSSFYKKIVNRADVIANEVKRNEAIRIIGLYWVSVAMTM